MLATSRELILGYIILVGWVVGTLIFLFMFFEGVANIVYILSIFHNIYFIISGLLAGLIIGYLFKDQSLMIIILVIGTFSLIFGLWASSIMIRLPAPLGVSIIVGLEIMMVIAVVFSITLFPTAFVGSKIRKRVLAQNSL